MAVIRSILQHGGTEAHAWNVGGAVGHLSAHSYLECFSSSKAMHCRTCGGSHKRPSVPSASPSCQEWSSACSIKRSGPTPSARIQMMFPGCSFDGKTHASTEAIHGIAGLESDLEVGATVLHSQAELLEALPYHGLQDLRSASRTQASSHGVLPQLSGDFSR